MQLLRADDSQVQQAAAGIAYNCRQSHGRQLTSDHSCYLLSQTVLQPGHTSAVNTFQGSQRWFLPRHQKLSIVSCTSRLQPYPSRRSMPLSCHAHCCRRVQAAKSNHLTLLRAGSGSSGHLTGGQQSAPESVCRCHQRPPAVHYPEAGAERGTGQTRAPQNL